MKRKQVVKIPYEGYTLPKSAEKGWKFIDFNKILKPLKKVKIKRRKNDTDWNDINYCHPWWPNSRIILLLLEEVCLKLIDKYS